MSLAEPDKLPCTAGAATYNFNDENFPRSNLEVEDTDSNSGELPQGTRPAFLLALRCSEWVLAKAGRMS
ncbi:MAG: hypothetical protein P1U85_23540, partial [Verrucomicrobiales bacterium]|nr:hypothetical protein [Verrucomicrobiales bacterium]